MNESNAQNIATLIYLLNPCNFVVGENTLCGNRCEGKTNYCATHNSMMRKAEKVAAKKAEKLVVKLLKSKDKQIQPKTSISKNPKDWKNTFLCSDGTKVTQAEINIKRSAAYKRYDQVINTGNKCEGCGGVATNHAHIIPQSRCKKIGKTQLIWWTLNFFKACNACNLAIENPKGKDWRYLRNIDQCLLIIKGHDPELYTKFENSAIDQTRTTI